MDEALTEVKQERSFDNHLDLSPIEHMLFGSSLILPDGRVLNSGLLRTDRKLGGNANLLLKPFGLSTGESSLKEIRIKRTEQKAINGWYVCFEPIRELLIDGYGFDYILDNPDESGKIPNQFKFRITKNTSSGSDQDIDMFRKIKLDNKFLCDTEGKPLFSLSKNEEEGTLTLTYLPLQENTNK